MINRLNGNDRSDDPLARKIIGLAMEVYRNLGCGFLESVYCNALALELQSSGLSFEREKRFFVTYKGVEIGYFDADFLIQGRIVVEAKAVESLSVAHSVQLVNYLAAGKLDLGVLLNFGGKSLEFKTKTRIYTRDFQAPDLQA